MMESFVLELQNVSKQYKGQKGETLQVLKNINLQLKQGECAGLVGESGCGKSTIAKIISQLTPVTSGRLLCNGDDCTNLKKKELKAYYKQVQLVFQDPLATFSPRMKIGAYLMEPFINFKLAAKKEARMLAAELLEMVGLPAELASRFPHELSGGQLQRVVIARAIGMRPDIIICDESTSALDVTIQRQVLQLLTDLRIQTNISCIFITHDLAVAESMCDKVYIMHEGEIVEEIQSANLVRDAKHPYTKKLLDSVISVEREKEIAAV